MYVKNLVLFRLINLSWGGHWWSGDGGGDNCDVGGLQPSTWFEDIDSWCSLRWNLVLVKLQLSSHLVHLAHCLKAQALRVKHSNSKPRQHLSLFDEHHSLHFLGATFIMPSFDPDFFRGYLGWHLGRRKYLGWPRRLLKGTPKGNTLPFENT